MTPEYVQTVSQALTLMAEMLANPKEITPTLVQGWALVLFRAGMPREAVPAATETVLAQQTFFPTPAAFLKAWKPPKDLSLDAERAWQCVLHCVRVHGWAASLCASDLGGDRAALWSLHRLGFARLCEELTAEEQVRAMFRNEWGRVYTLARADGAVLAYLPGSMELQNRKQAAAGHLCGRPDWKAFPDERRQAIVAGDLPWAEETAPAALPEKAAALKALPPPPVAPVAVPPPDLAQAIGRVGRPMPGALPKQETPQHPRAPIPIPPPPNS